jgi:hypothetical protein
MTTEIKKENFFKTKEQITHWLNSKGVMSYTIHKDLTVDLHQGIIIKEENLNYLPIQFNQVQGDFICSFCDLKTLKGSPKKVLGDFICSNNLLTSLKYAPQKIGQKFDCSKNQIANLSFFPKDVGGPIFIFSNSIKKLKNLPQKVKDFNCSSNQLKSLKGSPEIVKGGFNCSENQLENLVGGPKIVVEHFNCTRNKLNTLLGAPEKVKKDFNCSFNQLTNLEHLPNNIQDLLCKYNQIDSLKGLRKAQNVYASHNTLKNIDKDDFSEINIKEIIISPDTFLKSYLDSPHFQSLTTKLDNVQVGLTVFKEIINMNNELLLLEQLKASELKTKKIKI